jgi:hypothetical protein
LYQLAGVDVPIALDEDRNGFFVMRDYDITDTLKTAWNNVREATKNANDSAG